VSARRTLLVFSIALFLVAALVAQTPDTAIIRGTVTDRSGAVVPSATVVLISGRTQQQRTAQTDQSGNYSFAGVPAGVMYDLVAKYKGFVDTPVRGIAPTAGTAIEIPIELRLAGPDYVDQVYGAASEVRTDQPQLGTPISEAQIEAMPLLNRRITFLPLMNAANRPAISQGDIFTNQNLFTTNGAGRRQTWFEVDGGNGVDLWGRQTIFSTIPDTLR